jgi:lysophospholipase L1-like esterase
VAQDKPLARHLRRLFFLASLAIALAAGELVARRTYGEGFTESLVDRWEDHTYRPFLDTTQAWQGVRHRLITNSLGWRDSRPGRVVPKTSPRRRILFLGDSFVEGVGLEQEESLAGVVQGELGEAGEVINGGRSSFSPLLEYQRLKRFLAAGYHTDALVVFLDVSDIEDEVVYNARFAFAPSGEPLHLAGWLRSPVPLALFNGSALVRSILRFPADVRHAVSPDPDAAFAPSELPGDLAGSAPISSARYLELSPLAQVILRPSWMAHRPSLEGWARDGLASSFANLARMERLARSRGIPFVVVIYPWPQMLYTRDDPALYTRVAATFPGWFAQREALLGRAPSPVVSEYQSQARRFCAARGIPLIDLIPDLQAVPDWYELYIPGDVHFNAAGSRLLGRRIAARLRGLLP